MDMSYGILGSLFRTGQYEHALTSLEERSGINYNITYKLPTLAQFLYVKGFGISSS